MTKPDTKTALFIKPSRLNRRWSPIELIHITRTARGLDYAREALDPDLVGKYFGAFPMAMRNILVALGDEALQQTIQQLTRNHAKQKAGTSLTAYIDRSLLRTVHQLFIQLLPFAQELGWYHQVVNPATGNPLTAGCVLHSEMPRLSFKVHRAEDGMLQLLVFVTIAGEPVPLSDFTRDFFFLMRDKNYFLLSFADYQTLQWLSANDPLVYGYDAAGFSTHVLQRLEADYEVEMGSLLNKQVITVEPVNAIYLSEISGSFLMLTPRWNYDGFWVEGPWQHTEEFTRNGEVFVVKRHLEKEKSFHDTLQTMHPNFSRQLNGVFNLPFAEAKKKHWFLKVYHQLLEDNVELLGMEMLKHFRYSPFPVVTDLQIIKTVDSTMHLFMRVSFGKEEVPLAELQKLLLAAQKSLMLKDHSIGVLTEEWLNQYSLLLKHGKVSKNELIVPQWILLGMEQVEGAGSARPAIPADWWKRWLQWQQSDAPVYMVPAMVNATLRPYQQKGFEWICLLSEIDAGACLADDMGLGKTLQTICFLAHLSTRRVKPGGWYMIVCPASLMHNWRAELEKFAAGLGAFVYHNSSRDLDAFFASGAQVLITSYGTMRSDFDLLQAIHWEAIVLDESHTIKNPSAQVTKAVYQLRARSRVALSGTPVMNNTFDLYAQLQFLVPGLFGGPEFFRKEYAYPIDRERSEEKIQALQKITAPFVLRRTKQQVATDLPPKTESVMWCEMGADQKALYDETKARIRDSLFLNIKSEGLNKSKLSILQGMQKLRQICAAPQLLKEGGLQAVSSIKAELLLEELQVNLRNNKVLVFSQFKGMLHLIGDACRKAGLAYYHFDGETPPEKRSELVAQFQSEGNTVNIFLISLKAGNTGLTLTAADYVFLVDPWWNTAVQQQAIDRAYRIGQTKNVFAYQMICKDSIEEKIVELQERKKALSDALIAEDESFLKQLSEEDIRYLFS
ncbi:DEAD/DEAH box helicase [Flavihumibacter fluvii]|uniref:DEAD/DEAH box helicase n=1 Tax=Flavihumibacter fluvii TaxID=2838157 RepID=UPI001BDEA1EF|nr:DEAD/DEAH box helicase [Flavihumibacter fluvii]ULQ51897.1 DEAD/DEAH box helicase [Flavihumibacter fluvii]